MPTLGVCSWSLQPTSARALAEGLTMCGVRAVQLALDPLRAGEWREDEALAALRGVTILSGMMATEGEDYSTLERIRITGGLRPDHHWDANLAAARENAALAARLRIGLITLHAGFLPHDRHHPLRATMLERLRRVMGVFGEVGVRVALETGQEDAPTLLEVLHELRAHNPGVNFDPANMILYAMGDPIEALRLLGPHVAQVHIKDAVPSGVPEQWGTEVPVGAGHVDWPAFFGVLREHCPHVNLVIEREAGSERVHDIAAAARLVRLYGAAS